MKRLFDSANKKSKEAEKKSDAATMKALVIESNTSREWAQKIEKKDIPAVVKEIHEIEQISNIEWQILFLHIYMVLNI